MTSLKDQMKLLKDAGKGVIEGVKKASEPFVKEAVILPEVKKLYGGIKTEDSKKQKRLTSGIKAANRDKAKVKK